MKSGDDDFRPRLGRIRAKGGRASKRYLGKLYAAMEKARPGVFARRSRARFTGARIGRGSGVAAAFASRSHPFAKFRARRVAVKIRSVRLGVSGLSKARAHLRYIQRDGTDKDGAPGKLYGPDSERIDNKAFLESGGEDRHQFRIIISPEDAGDLEDLKGFTRDVMAAAEQDLGTKLDWVAVDHYNTDHPHSHVVLRGKADDGKDLVIARNYITHGFRRRAEEITTLELGPRRDVDIARSRVKEVSREAFTKLDQEIASVTDADGAVKIAKAATPYDQFRKRLWMARLKKLEAMNLAARDSDGWRLSSDVETALKEIGRCGDIIRSMGAALGADLAPARVGDFADDGVPGTLTGRVAGGGAIDDGHDNRFLAIEGADGNQWRVAVDFEPGAAPPAGAVVEIEKAGAAPRKSDVTISAIANRHGGVYSDVLHRQSDPSAGEAYRMAHKRRLEALRRVGIVSRADDGSWAIPENYLERAAAFEGKAGAARVRTLSWVSLDALGGAPVQTFLDDVIEGKRDISLVDYGFGAALDKALAARRRWLLSKGLAQELGGRINIDRKALKAREHANIKQAGEKLSQSLGKKFYAVEDGDRIDGVYRRPVDLPSGRFALVEKSKEFALAPWRPVLEKQRGMEIAGTMKRGSVQWTFGRKGPGIGG